MPRFVPFVNKDVLFETDYSEMSSRTWTLCVKFTREYLSSQDELFYYVLQTYKAGYSGDLNSKL